MCELLAVPADKLHTSQQLPFGQLALVETLSVGLHAVTRALPGPDDSVLVVGAGPIGLGVVLHALRTGANVTLADVNEQRLIFADSALAGTARVIRVRAEPEVSLRTALGPNLPTIVFDATGNLESMQRSIEVAGPGGCVTFVGLTQGSVCFDDASFHARELRVLASRNATAADFRATISLLEDGSFDIGAWVTDRSSSKAIIGQFPDWAGKEPPLVKAQLEF